MTTHRHVCACGEDWLCTKRDCDIPAREDCTRCARRKIEQWGIGTGYYRQDNARAIAVSALRQMRED
uniref:Uncharacterized protein n=1 Tax=viral metagenome TaxID=1070528 RepID=A0A6M3J742_9ZZZZ